jgi:hypothetical protein
MDYTLIFQNQILPLIVNVFTSTMGYCATFFETTIGSVILIFGCLYLVKIGLKIFHHIQNERFNNYLGL